jgi:hypothetical protein
MTNMVSSGSKTNRIPNTAPDQLPEHRSESADAQRAWPGKSEPGHIKPIGPAYRSGRKAPPVSPETKKPADAR